MALAIEPDFLSVKPARSQEPASPGTRSSGNGEAFANTLSETRSRDADTDTRQTAPPDAATGAFVLAPPPPEPIMARPDPEGRLTETAPSAATEAAPDIDMAALADPAIGSELEIDRDLAAARTKIDLAAPPQAPERLPAAETASPDRVALTPKTQTAAQTPAAPAADPTKAAAADAPADVAPPVTGDAVIQVAVAAPAAPRTGEAGKVAAESDRAGWDGVAAPAGKDPATVAAIKTTDAPDSARLPGDPAPDTPASVLAAATDPLSKPAGGDTTSPTTSAAPAISLVAAAPSAATPAPVAAPVMTPAHGLITASPVDVVDIVAKSAADGQSDSVVIQLDPPELGRVSIDFKFDAQGLQHITITGETPEALRQLRLMHFELANALDRQGVGSHTMSFQQQQQNAQSSRAPHPFGTTGSGDDGAGLAAPALVAANRSNTPGPLPGGRLDIRL